MNAMPERVIVLGAGAIGASVGALLFEAGVPCLLVARGEHGRALIEKGVEMRLPQGARRVPVPAVRSLAEASPTPRDLVILSTMAHDTAAALEGLDDGIPVASFQNGLPCSRCALAAVVYLLAERVAPGVVALPGVPVLGSIFVGEGRRGADHLAPWLAERLRASGIRAELEPNIMPWLRAKLLTNLGGIVFALCDDPPMDMIESAQAEARAVWHATRDAFEDIPALMARVGPLEIAPVDGRIRIGGSTRAALARHATLETDALHGPIVAAGKAAGVRTPVNEALIEVARRAERERWSPGRLDAHELRGIVELATRLLET
jgi:ketopantoate reductase